jgi:hypothetical protein
MILLIACPLAKIGKHDLTNGVAERPTNGREFS